MDIGTLIIYNGITGTILNNSLNEMSGTIQNDLRPDKIGFISLPYGYQVKLNESTIIPMSRLISYKINVDTKEIIVHSYLDENWEYVDLTTNV